MTIPDLTTEVCLHANAECLHRCCAKFLHALSLHHVLAHDALEESTTVCKNSLDTACHYGHLSMLPLEF